MNIDRIYQTALLIFWYAYFNYLSLKFSFSCLKFYSPSTIVTNAKCFFIFLASMDVKKTLKLFTAKGFSCSEGIIRHMSMNCFAAIQVWTSLYWFQSDQINESLTLSYTYSNINVWMLRHGLLRGADTVHRTSESPQRQKCQYLRVSATLCV